MTNPLKIAIFDCSSTQMAKMQPVMFLVFQYQQITAKELIRRRVYHEVEQFQQRREVMNTLVKFDDNGAKTGNYATDMLDKIDAKYYYEQAIKLFKNNGFFIIVDGKQITELDEMIMLRENSQIEFFRLAQLVGG